MPTPYPSKRSLREKVYSYRFASETVEAFVTKYSRATVFIAEKIGWTPKELKYCFIKMFMYKNTAWNLARDTVKRVERHNLYSSLSPLSSEDVKKYLTVVKSMVTDDWLDNVKDHYNDLTRVKS